MHARQTVLDSDTQFPPCIEKFQDPMERSHAKSMFSSLVAFEKTFGNGDEKCPIELMGQKMAGYIVRKISKGKLFPVQNFINNRGFKSILYANGVLEAVNNGALSMEATSKFVKNFNEIADISSNPDIFFLGRRKIPGLMVKRYAPHLNVPNIATYKNIMFAYNSNRKENFNLLLLSAKI